MPRVAMSTQPKKLSEGNMQRDEINKFSESLTAKEASTSNSELPGRGKEISSHRPWTYQGLRLRTQSR